MSAQLEAIVDFIGQDGDAHCLSSWERAPTPDQDNKSARVTTSGPTRAARCSTLDRLIKSGARRRPRRRSSDGGVDDDEDGGDEQKDRLKQFPLPLPIIDRAFRRRDETIRERDERLPICSQQTTAATK